MLVEDDRLGGERGARQLEAHLGRRVHILVARGRGHGHDHLVQVERLPRRLHERDMPVVRRVERTAEEADHGTNSNDSSPTTTGVPRRAPASRRARSSSASPGGAPTTRKPSSVRSRLQGRTFGWGR